LTFTVPDDVAHFDAKVVENQNRASRQKENSNSLFVNYTLLFKKDLYLCLKLKTTN